MDFLIWTDPVSSQKHMTERRMLTVEVSEAHADGDEQR